MSNTTRQVELWKPGDAITSVRLNEMAEAINFLLKTSGYIFNRVALANYHAAESSGTDFDYPGIIQEVQISESSVSPHINAGRLVLPASTGTPLTEAGYSSTASAPYIEGTKLFLNLASDASSAQFPGAISGLTLYDPTAPSVPAYGPGIYAGEIKLPQFVTEAEYNSIVRVPTVFRNILRLPLSHNEASNGIDYPGAVQSVLLYDPSDPSSPASPGIFNGVVKIPRGVEEASYSETISEPTISRGKLTLPLAHSEASAGSYVDQTGSIAGLRLYDPSDPSSPSSPGIFNGVINLPSFSAEGVSSVSYGYTGASSPAPGVDGWVQTLYFWAVNSGSATLHSYGVRQLMRVNGSVLEVVQQITNDGETWTESSV